MLRPTSIVLGGYFSLAACAATPPESAHAPKPTSVTNAGTPPAASKADGAACKDFDAFANDAWRAEHPIPKGKSRYGRRDLAKETTRKQIAELASDLGAKGGSLVGDFYASCTNQPAADAAGLAPVAPLLDSIRSARDAAGVQAALRKLHDLSIHAGFAFGSMMSFPKPADFVGNIGAGALGLPSREHYLGKEPKWEEARAKYQARVTELLKLAGAKDAEAKAGAEATLAMETRLAEASLDADTAADPAKTNRPTTFAELGTLAPHVDWARYFDEAHVAKAPLNLSEPKLLAAFDKELAKTPVAAWRAFLTVRLMETAAPWLGERFQDGPLTAQARGQQCVEQAETWLGDALGRAYVEKHFPPEAKAKVRAMLSAELELLRGDVERNEWMQPATKRTALAKLAVYDIQVGYPDKWIDYGALAFRRDAAPWISVAAARRFATNDARSLAGKPTDKARWQLPATSSGAYIDLQLHNIVLPAGFLQAIFRLDANDAENYGMVGASAAHDMLHVVDTLGDENDVEGRPVHWWTDADKRSFDEVSACVVRQYDGYFVEPGVHEDGKKVLGEANGDAKGLSLAYRALVRSMATKPVPTVQGFTPEQQFFLAYAHMRGEGMTLEAQRDMVKKDIHAAPRFRVNGPLSTMPEFQRAFGCDAVAQCVVW